MVSAGRAGALAGSPPIFSGRTSNAGVQPASPHAAASSAHGARRLCRAFDIMCGESHTALHNDNNIGQDGFQQVNALNMAKPRTTVPKPKPPAAERKRVQDK